MEGLSYGTPARLPIETGRAGYGPADPRGGDRMFLLLAVVCVVISAVLAGLDAKPFIWNAHDWLVAGLVFAFLSGGSTDLVPWRKSA